jgi:hypothetical protein
MSEKQATTNVVACVWDALDGPPIYQVPPYVSPSRIPPSSEYEPPTSLWKGEGRVLLLSVLSIRVFAVKPTSLIRGEGLIRVLHVVGRVLRRLGRMVVVRGMSQYQP